ncbi:MAG: M20 family metallopeptidase [Sphaerobacter sp.]|nr:M20 family metallopeptidase [Sphaerobacter sp.]
MSAVDVVELLVQLVAIESVNPAYPGPASGEAALARFVADFCRAAGAEVRTREILPGRPNVVATLRSGRPGPALVFEAHLDTVGILDMGEAALRPRIAGDRLYGRGACDVKGGLAAMLAALAGLAPRRSELPQDLVLAAVIDEEATFQGVRGFLDEGLPIGAAVVAEPTDLRVVVAHKGCVRWRIRTVGRAAHSARPDEGLNAIDQMAEVVRALRVELQPRLATRCHPLLGRPTLSVGTIAGGTGVNVVPARCVVEVDRRLIPGETAASALAEVDAVLAELRRAQPWVTVEREEPSIVDGCLDTPPDAAIVQAALAACRQAGYPGEPTGVPYGTDASKFAARGIPSIVLGPGSITHAHSAHEFIPLTELHHAVAIYSQIALSPLGS